MPAGLDIRPKLDPKKIGTDATFDKSQLYYGVVAVRIMLALADESDLLFLWCLG